MADARENLQSKSQSRSTEEAKENEESGLRRQERGQIRDHQESYAENLQRNRLRDVELPRRSHDTESRYWNQKRDRSRGRFDERTQQRRHELDNHPVELLERTSRPFCKNVQEHIQRQSRESQDNLPEPEQPPRERFQITSELKDAIVRGLLQAKKEQIEKEKREALENLKEQMEKDKREALENLKEQMEKEKREALENLQEQRVKVKKGDQLGTQEEKKGVEVDDKLERIQITRKLKRRVYDR